MIEGKQELINQSTLSDNHEIIQVQAKTFPFIDLNQIMVPLDQSWSLNLLCHFFLT